ncbi:MAG: hypothetical protein EBX17_08560 [Betaproteobacteria bacterium]|nr:hypothetical protein [Betaproteobacteria bacterium]
MLGSGTVSVAALIWNSAVKLGRSNVAARKNDPEQAAGDASPKAQGFGSCEMLVEKVFHCVPAMP